MRAYQAFYRNLFFLPEKLIQRHFLAPQHLTRNFLGKKGCNPSILTVCAVLKGTDLLHTGLAMALRTCLCWAGDCIRFARKGFGAGWFQVSELRFLLWWRAWKSQWANIHLQPVKDFRRSKWMPERGCDPMKSPPPVLFDRISLWFFFLFILCNLQR